MRNNESQARQFVIAILVIAAILMPTVWLIGSSNPGTPAGYVGYVTQGAIFGKKQFVCLQTGPNSPGRSWLYAVTNVSITPYTYNELFDDKSPVLSKDSLRVRFAGHILWRIKAADVRDFVENYGEESENPEEVVTDAYNSYIKEPFRTALRNEIQKYDAFNITQQINLIQDDVKNVVVKWAAKTPFEIMAVQVGNVQFPEEVANAVAAKLATEQRLQQKEFDLKIADKDREIRVKQAEGIAEAMQKINNQLTGMYVQYEAVEAQKAQIGSPNHSVIYIPVGPMGVPIVGTFNAEGKPERPASQVPMKPTPVEKSEK
jgi:regulator of protease activity HflC (stomatin/prohibitin superfamily)